MRILRIGEKDAPSVGKKENAGSGLQSIFKCKKCWLLRMEKMDFFSTLF
jgi:hypothetical protein